MLKTLRIALILTVAAYAVPASAMVMCSHGMVGHGHDAAMVTHDSGLTRSEYTFFPTPTAWDPGANTARIGGHPAPGGATWSIMGAGIGDSSGFDDHGGVSTAITGLGVAGWGVADYANMINAMLDVWAAASGFTNLGQVADSGVGMGAAEADGGHLGDIRIGALPFDGVGSVLAHAYQPGTESIFGPGGTIAGDVHMDSTDAWVDGDGAGFDIFTVMLHELGHALGLGHTDVVGSVMFPFYGGVLRTLQADDLAGIQALYGAPTVDVPEPGTLWLLGMGLLALGWSRRRSS